MAMLDDAGTSCATTNATPETSFAPTPRVGCPTGLDRKPANALRVTHS